MTNQDIERLINIEVGELYYSMEATGFRNGAQYVLNNFMPKWVSVEDGLPTVDEDNPSISEHVIGWDGTGWAQCVYSFDLKIWFPFQEEPSYQLGITHWYIPQPPNE